MRLFLCEKPSQGKDIGRILGATQRGEGCLNASGVTVTWCIGHLVEAAAPEVYDAALKRWSLEQLPIIPQQWRVEVKPKTATQFKKVVKALLAKATQLVIATDADREGELIAREIIDLCGYRGPIERLWLSALNDASIRTALAKLRPSAETLPMYYSALARSRADWLVGMNLSRLFTVLGRQAGYDGVLSVGRTDPDAQTRGGPRPRDRGLRVRAVLGHRRVAVRRRSDVHRAVGGTDASTDDAGRCLRQPVAQQAAQQIRAAGSAQVVSVETERVREGPPLLFDLGTLQEVCSKQRAGRAGNRRSPRPCTRRTRPRRTRARIRATCPKACSPKCPRSWTACSRPIPRWPRSWASSTAPALARLERRQGDGAPRHHPDARTRESPP